MHNIACLFTQSGSAGINVADITHLPVMHSNYCLFYLLLLYHIPRSFCLRSSLIRVHTVCSMIRLIWSTNTYSYAADVISGQHFLKKILICLNHIIRDLVSDSFHPD